MYMYVCKSLLIYIIKQYNISHTKLSYLCPIVCHFSRLIVEFFSSSLFRCNLTDSGRVLSK